MSQRESGYKRKRHDAYQTPEWVTKALLPHLPQNLVIWESACGKGRMANVLRTAGHTVYCSDMLHKLPEQRINFLRAYKSPILDVPLQAIVTNPPYEHSRRFIEHALNLTKPYRGKVVMLLRTDYDHAATRRHLFAGHNAFACKLVLTKRIIWFKKKGAAPSYNHAWFIWDWQHAGPPRLAYGP